MQKQPTRRRFTVFIIFLFALAAPAFAADRPNIIIILADDMGYSDIGCYGGEIDTPNLDKLAAEGVRFTQFYNTCRCCPTRAALLTGLYSHEAGVGHMVDDQHLPGYRGVLNDQCRTIAESLRDSGYTTLMCGKWHVGSQRGHWPTDRGFDRYFGTPTGGGVYFKDTLNIRDTVFFVDGDQKIELPDDFYVTDSLTDHAMRFIDDAAKGDKPFFLYLAHIAPHWPLQAKPADIAKYEGKYDMGWDAVRAARYKRQVEMGIVKRDWELSKRDDQSKAWDSLSEEHRKDLSHRMSVYAAQVDCLDQNVGKLMAKLEALRLMDSTLVMFLSDNGCSAEGGPGGFSRGFKGVPIGEGTSYASVGLEWANASNTPFRKYKTRTEEGGISTPLIVHWPAKIAAGQRGSLNDSPGHVIDLMPTCLAAAGAKYAPEADLGKYTPLEGRSLMPALSGGSVERDEICWEHEGNRAIRMGDWKAVSPKGAAWQLYNLAVDRTETRNLSSEDPKRTAELAKAWEAWAIRVHAEPSPWDKKGKGKGPADSAGPSE
ncbi:MAG: sulfatase-like hydrolase/transferase [Planctomycetes bacterium]|nr:sulfatase-like hydrolase/transferase [Planctomycetota bacterium]